VHEALYEAESYSCGSARDLVGLHARLSRKSNFTYEKNALALSSATRFMPSDCVHTLQVVIIKLNDGG
jgi:hypothetical protein